MPLYGDVTGCVVSASGDVTGSDVCASGDVTGSVVCASGDVTGSVVSVNGDVECSVTSGICGETYADVVTDVDMFGAYVITVGGVVTGTESSVTVNKECQPFYKHDKHNRNKPTG